MNEIIEYIKAFLLYGNTEAAKQVGYTADASAWSQYKAVIVPCGHLGSEIVLPDMSRPVIDRQDKTYIIRTDILYNTFFFISRAEELINPQRDKYGRFLAAYSVLGRGNNLEIPLVDEYARILMKLLDLPLPDHGYERIYLTHDIDTLSYYRHLRGAVGGILRGHLRDVFASWRSIKNDPAYTFPWIVEQDTQVPHAESVYFVKYTLGKGYDYPQYLHRGKDYLHLMDYLCAKGAILGVHSSCYGLPKAGSLQERFFPHHYAYHRSHYLCCSIDNMQRVADMGFTDDFSMAFADKAGFRLQTTRPVRWINPKTYTLTPLTLHPLTIMDCTLSNTGYMHLDEDEAYFYSEQLLDRVRRYRGEVVLLWHNTIFNSTTYHASLYQKLLKGLRHYTNHPE